MRFVFDEDKAAEAAAHLLTRAGQPMTYFKLIKLLYLADREALIRSGYPITGDRMVSMPHGPVLSLVLDKVNLGKSPSIASGLSPWFEYVSEPDGYNVSLKKAPPRDGALSDFEIELLGEIFDRYGHLDNWALRDLTHELPEYIDPQGSMVPIEPEVILHSAGKPDSEIQAIVDDAEAFVSLRRSLSRK